MPTSKVSSSRRINPQTAIRYFLLFFLPFVVLPFGISPFETPKIYLAELALIALILLFLSQGSPRFLLDRRFLPIGIFGGLGLVQAVIMPSRLLFFGNQFRMEGLFLFFLLLCFAVISSRLKSVEPSARFITALLGLQLIATLFIAGKADARAIGTLGEANSLAGFAVFLVPFLLFRKKGGSGDWEDWKVWLGIGFAIVIILVSGSRSGAIAVGIEFIFFFLQRYHVRFAVLVCLLLLVGSFFLPQHDQPSVFENRAVIWQTALSAGLARPLLGWGVGNTEIALRETAKRLGNPLRYVFVDNTHNIFLQFWVELGVIGAVTFVFMLLYAGYQFVKQKKMRELGLLFGLVTILSFNPVSVVLLLAFWYVSGQGLLWYNNSS